MAVIDDIQVIEIEVEASPQVISVSIPGMQGPAGQFAMGPVTTGAAGTNASAVVNTINNVQTVYLTIPRGSTGLTGATGPANTLAIGTVTASAAGGSASATITGTSPNQTLNLVIPRGIQGTQGDVGPVGPANTLTIGTVTTGSVGGPAAATITGTAPNQTLNLTIPQGVQGIQGTVGPTGPANTLTIGTVTTGASGAQASATITGTAPNQTLNLTIPSGTSGTITGTSTTSFAVGTGSKAFTTQAGLALSVGNFVRVSSTSVPTTYMAGPITAYSGTTLTVNVTETAGTGTIASWTIGLSGVQGNVGLTGNTGPANTLSIGTVTNGTAAATITGTAPNQTLNLVLPTGPTGPTGGVGPTGPTGPAGPTGAGVLVLAEGAAVPGGTPVNQVIFRNSTSKIATYYWGSGTTLPSTGLTVGDTYFHTAWACMFQYTGNLGWRQTEIAKVATESARDSLTVTYASSLHNDFRVEVSLTTTPYQRRVWRWSVPATGSGGWFLEWANVPPTQLLTLASGWYNWSSGYEQLGAWRSPDGAVHVHGLVGNTNTISGGFVTIATLPAGFRPLVGTSLQTIHSNGSIPARLDILTSGNMDVYAPNPVATSYWDIHVEFNPNQLAA
jgi:hypothetical protein